MPYVKRDEKGNVVAASLAADAGCPEEVAASDPALAVFLQGMESEVSTLLASDLDLIRVLEDVVELLIAKGVILFTELPADAQQKILRRQRLRARVGDLQNLIGDD